jgi:hypothetical protein
MAAGVGLFLLLGAAALLWLRREALPRLTRADFDAAEALWRKNGPRSYDLDVVVSGNQPGRIHVEVRDGRPTAMTRNGVTPGQRRTWYPWTVPGQFDTIRFELDAATDPQGSFGGVPGGQLVLRARFDPRDGRPLRYERIVLGRQMDAAWEVVRFEPR